MKSYLSTMRLDLGSLSLTWGRGDIFKPLDSTKKQIRLLKIVSPAPHDTHPQDLACTLHIESLDSDLQFDAISYCWGQGKKRQKLYVDGNSFRVTEAVFEILTALKSATAISECLWIDSICINQLDNTEKSFQIPMMEQIFSQAQIVHVWLGPAIRDLDKLLMAVEIAKSRVEEFEDMSETHVESSTICSPDATFDSSDEEPPKIQMARRAAAVLKEPDRAALRPLWEILSSPWWYRLWVVQESVLARTVILRCGSFTIPWNTVMWAYRQLQIVNTLQTLYQGRLGEVPDQLSRKANHVYALFEELSQLAVHNRESRSPKDVLRFIYEMSDQSVTDPRDRIYGMLALLPGELRIQPDYSLSPVRIFTDFTLKFMNWSKSLNIIELAGRLTTSSDRSPKWQRSLPTWVPYFPSMRFETRSIDSNASRSAHYFAAERDVDRLAVRGHIIGRVTLLGQRMQLPPGPANIKEALRNWREMYFREEDSERAKRDRVVLFWRELVKKIQGVPARERAETLANMRAVSVELDAWLVHEASAMGKIAAMVVKLFVFLTNEVMVRFKGDHIGLCRGNLEQADLLVILAGCDQPVILRRQLDAPGRFEFIGVFTCADISHGEYIYDQAKLRVTSEGTSALPADVKSFLSSLVHLYLANEDYLWAVDLKRMKETLENCVRSMLNPVEQVLARIAIPYVWDVMYKESTASQDENANVPVAIIEVAASTVLHRATDFEKLLETCFSLTMRVYERLRAPLDETSGLDMEVAVEDVKDAALRFGLLIFEIHKRAYEIGLKAERDSFDEGILVMEDALLSGHYKQPRPEAERSKWLQGLRLAAEEFLRVEARVDEVFEEIVLV